MARRTSFINALATAHARSVREAHAAQRHHVAQVRRMEQARAAAARADAAEQRAYEASIRAQAASELRDAKAREREEREFERRNLREAKEAERQAHQDAQEGAEEKTLEAEEFVLELKGILAATLTVDDRIEFDSLRVHDPAPALNLPVLTFPTYTPEALTEPVKPPALEPLLAAKVKPPSFIERLFRLTRHQRQTAEVSRQHQGWTEKYQRDLAALAKRRAEHRTTYSSQCERLQAEHAARVEEMQAKHREALQAFEAKRNQRDAEVTQLEESYRRGDVDAILLYSEMALSRSDYPAGFPQQFRLSYQPDSRQLVIDFELPTPSIVPAVAEYRYIKARRTIEEKPRKPAEIKSVYREVVAQTTLRTLHEVLEADQGNHLDAVVFSGYINKIDETTGTDIRPYLVSVRVTKDAFLAVNLSRVEPQACLRNLGAQVSPSPEEARPVRPVVEFDMVDPRFIGESDVLSQLDARPNLMELTPSEFEGLVSNLFTQMGLETKLTRSSRDGGVDAVAFDTRPILGGKVVIQAKRYRHTVGVSAVRDLFGTMLNEGATKGIIVTTSGYGPDAFGFANDKPLELIDGGGLLYLLESIGRPARIIMPVDE